MSRSKKDGRCGGGHRVYNHGVCGTGWDYWTTPGSKKFVKRKTHHKRRRDTARTIQAELLQLEIDYHEDLAELRALELEHEYGWFADDWSDYDEPMEEPEYDDPMDYYDFDPMDYYDQPTYEDWAY